jgi:hypothetical protein
MLIPNKLRVGVELIRISSSIYFYFISNYCSDLKKKVTMQLHLCAPQHLISICIFDYTYIFFLSVNKLKYILIKLFMICIGKFSSQFSCFSKYRLDLKFQVLLINHTTANYFSDGILINWYLFRRTPELMITIYLTLCFYFKTAPKRKLNQIELNFQL